MGKDLPLRPGYLWRLLGALVAALALLTSPGALLAQEGTQASGMAPLSTEAWLLMLLGGLAWTAFVFFLLWSHYGRDPQKGAVVSRLEPPPGLSPAGARFLVKHRVDGRCLASGVVSLAVKGMIRVRCDRGQGSSAYWLERRDDGNRDQMSPDEARLFDALMGSSRKKLELGPNASRELLQAREACRAALERCYGSLYRRNLMASAVGLMMTLFPLAVVFHNLGNPERARPLLLVMVLSTAVTGLFGRLMESSLSERTRWGAVAVLLTLLGCGSWTALRELGSPWALPALDFALAALIGVVAGVFIVLMDAPTEEGQKLWVQLEGLALAMEDRKFPDPEGGLQKTAELFEGLLPYALSLEREQLWGERFSVLLAPGLAGEPYRAAWCGSLGVDLGELAPVFSAMIQTITAVLKAPSSGHPIFDSGGFRGSL